MIDLETLGVASDSVILSIGAVKFNMYPFIILDRFHVGLDTEEQEKKGRRAYSNTCFWWMQQNQDAREKINKIYKQHPIEVLGGLQKFIGNDCSSVWGNGAMFDNALVLSLAESFSCQRPWSYKLDCCYRTMKNIYPNVAPPERVGTHHDALDDAEFQAIHLDMIFTYASNDLLRRS